MFLQQNEFAKYMTKVIDFLPVVACVIQFDLYLLFPPR